MSIRFVARNVNLAILVVPGRNLVPPPELAADAPVGDVVHPLVVGIDPVLGHKAHVAGLHGVNGFLGDGLTCGILWADFVHGHKPLVGEHGLDHLAGAGASRHHQFVLLHFHQQSQRVQVFDDLFAGSKAVHANVGSGCIAVDLGVQCQYANQRQLVALAHGVVILVVGGGDLDHAGAKSLVHVVIGNHRDGAAAQWQGDVFADQVGIAFVLWVHHRGHVAQHGLGAGGGHDQSGCHFAVDQLRTVSKGVTNVPQRAVFLFALHFEV